MTALRYRKARPPRVAWLIHIWGPPIDGFKIGPILEWRRTEALAVARARRVIGAGGRATLLGPYRQDDARVWP